MTIFRWTRIFPEKLHKHHSASHPSDGERERAGEFSASSNDCLNNVAALNNALQASDVTLRKAKAR